MWAGTETGKTKELKKARQATKQSVEKANVTSPEALVKKFSPLWVKAMTTAQADIKGMVQNMIKNDAYEKAERKIQQLRKLDDGIMSIESNSTAKPEFLNAAISQAIHMAASHYYPDETGNITRAYGSEFTSERGEGVQHLLKDISAGDQKKLGAVLSFFKRALITG